MQTDQSPSREAVALIEYLFGDQSNTDGIRVVDLCYTAFMNRDTPNPDDGGKSDWFTDTKPKIDKGIADMKARILALLTPAMPQPATGEVRVEQQEAAIEAASRYVLENSRRSNASLNDHQRDADTTALMTAYRDIIRKAVDSGHLAFARFERDYLIPATQADAAHEVGLLAKRILKLAPSAGLHVGIKIEPAKTEKRP